jgi:hypothetical protein
MEPLNEGLAGPGKEEEEEVDEEDFWHDEDDDLDDARLAFAPRYQAPQPKAPEAVQESARMKPRRHQGKGKGKGKGRKGRRETTIGEPSEEGLDSAPGEHQPVGGADPGDASGALAYHVFAPVSDLTPWGENDNSFNPDLCDDLLRIRRNAISCSDRTRRERRLRLK